MLTKWLLFVVVILGIVLCVLDIRDEGMMVKLSFGGNQVLYSCSILGGIIVLVAIVGLIFTNPKVRLRK